MLLFAQVEGCRWFFVIVKLRCAPLLPPAACTDPALPLLHSLPSGSYTFTFVVGEGTRTEVGRFLSWECAPEAPVNGELRRSTGGVRSQLCPAGGLLLAECSCGVLLAALEAH